MIKRMVLLTFSILNYSCILQADKTPTKLCSLIYVPAWYPLARRLLLLCAIFHGTIRKNCKYLAFGLNLLGNITSNTTHAYTAGRQVPIVCQLLLFFYQSSLPLFFICTVMGRTHVCMLAEFPDKGSSTHQYNVPKILGRILSRMK